MADLALDAVYTLSDEHEAETAESGALHEIFGLGLERSMDRLVASSIGRAAAAETAQLLHGLDSTPRAHGGSVGASASEGRAMKTAIRRPRIRMALPLVTILYFLSAGGAGAQGCLTDADIEQAVGDQIRSGAPLVDTSAISDRPLCSGLTVAQAIQRLREQAFPEEAAHDEAVRQGLIARERAPRRATVRQPARRASATRRARSTEPRTTPTPAAPNQKVRSKSGTSTSQQ